ncbi:MAG: hypothetical protein M3P42_07835 [Actinomycetota bacterium]|nr:hypothetical protein [Actinomycetota bacterium]
MRVAFGTIAAKRELPYARVLARSFAERHPKTPFFVLLADEIEGCFDGAGEPFRLLTFRDLEIPESEGFRFIHPRKQLTYAATPYFLSALVDDGFERAVFLKQESLVLGDLRPILELLNQSEIILTPHLLAPLEGDDGAARELNILQSGVCNVGLLGLRDSPESRRFLAWWADRVHDHCRHAIGEGLHYEQRWLDLVPAYFENARILRDPGANIGHWNLPERLRATPRLFRFSGFDPDRPAQVTQYSDRLSMEALGDAAELFADYAEALKQAGWDEAQAWPYAYDSFDDGVPIPQLARELYRELGELRAGLGDPFSTAKEEGFFRWLNEPVVPNRQVTRLWQAVYDRRPDVREAFPSPFSEDHDAFLHWTAAAGAAEHEIPSAFVAAARPG